MADKFLIKKDHKLEAIRANLFVVLRYTLTKNYNIVVLFLKFHAIIRATEGLKTRMLITRKKESILVLRLGKLLKLLYQKKDGAILFFAYLLLFFPLFIFAEEQGLKKEKIAEEKIVYFAIPGQPLDSALIEFALQAKLTLITPNDLVKNHQSSPVIGPFPPQKALARLLSKLPLTFQFDLRSSSLLIITREEPQRKVPKQVTREKKKFPTMEEVYVAGSDHVVNQGISKSLHIKYRSRGIVEAVSADDIGEYPEVNIAESLQRVVGISIDRNNNEGSKLTARGFGPDFNLITYNGRQMPGSDITATEPTATRSFDFNNLSSESISNVKIYKTGRANIPSGGIGATIDIESVRPLELPEQKRVIELRALNDTSSKNGEPFTPEISGLWSIKSPEEKFGLLFSGAYQKRNSHIEEVHIDSWLDTPVALDSLDTAEINNENQNPEQRYWYPRNYRVILSDLERTRANAQIVLQYSPIEDIIGTLDYNYSSRTDQAQRNELALWFNNGQSITAIDIDKNGTAVAATETGGDHTFANYDEARKNENKSLGLNLKYQVSDSFTFTFDTHNSTAKSFPEGHGNSAIMIMGLLIEGQSFDARGVDIPVIEIELFGDQENVQASDIDSLFGFARGSRMNTDITQIHLQGNWKNIDNGDKFLNGISFGVGYTDMYNRSHFTDAFFWAGGYAGFEDQYDDSLFTVRNTAGILDEFSGGLKAIDTYYTYDFESVVLRAGELFNWGPFSPPKKDTDDHRITETSTSAFLQVKLDPTIMHMPLNLVAGVRYEATDLNANSLQQKPIGITWVEPYYWITQLEEPFTYTDAENSYDNFLPNLDIDIEIKKGLIARLSLSKTMARADLLALRESATLIPFTGGGLARLGNPKLEPHTSKNADISLEWYYSEDSYVSLGYFSKHTNNFSIDKVSIQALFDITDPYNGPRAQVAREQISNEGSVPTDDLVWQRILDNQDIGIITSSDEDPLVQWITFKPENSENLNITGWELSLQHIFGESGFGSILNLTLVDGDVHYDNALSDIQFALPGISNSANAIAYYNKGPLQTRMAYHWRDEFLSKTITDAGYEPEYIGAYDQLDVRISYDITKKLTVLAEGLNVLGSSQRDHGRYKEQMHFAQAFDPRYSLGVRYSF